MNQTDSLLIEIQKQILEIPVTPECDCLGWWGTLTAILAAFVVYRIVVS